MGDVFTKVLSIEEGRARLRPPKKKAPSPDFPLLDRLIEGQEKYDYGIADAHMNQEMCTWLGMPTQAPSPISHLAGIIEYGEDEIPPLESC